AAAGGGGGGGGDPDGSSSSRGPAGHSCPDAPQDARAITCPVCSRVVPVSRGEDPNRQVDAHIAAGCPDPGTSTTGKAYANACTFKGCTKKELVPIVCSKCRKTFCIRHRLEADHACAGGAAAAAAKGGQASPPKQTIVDRQRQQSAGSGSASSRAGTPHVAPAARQNARASDAAQLDRDRRARLAQQQQQPLQQMTDDEQLALALQISEQEAQAQQGNGRRMGSATSIGTNGSRKSKKDEPSNCSVQ
ncbi:hypothetical protein BC831DRAFT_465094, partial [Entophlyctis helioformis]